MHQRRLDPGSHRCSSRFPNLTFPFRRQRREPQVSWGCAAGAWGLENATTALSVSPVSFSLRSSGLARFNLQAPTRCKRDNLAPPPRPLVGAETARAKATRLQLHGNRPELAEAPSKFLVVGSSITAQSAFVSVFSRLSCRGNRVWRVGGGHSPQENRARCRSRTIAMLAPPAPTTRSCPGTWCKSADPRRGSRLIRRPRRAA